MSSRIGRPTDNPKKNRLEIRLSDIEKNLLEKDSKNMSATKTDLLMEGYAMSHLITGEELKKRLIKEHGKLMKLNEMMQEQIKKIHNESYNLMLSRDEILVQINNYEERIEQNNWLCKVIKNQLKREFDYEI